MSARGSVQIKAAIDDRVSPLVGAATASAESAGASAESAAASASAAAVALDEIKRLLASHSSAPNADEDRVTITHLETPRSHEIDDLAIRVHGLEARSKDIADHLEIVRQAWSDVATKAQLEALMTDVGKLKAALLAMRDGP